MGRFTVTNAQWKYWLDREHAVRHRTLGTETLVSLAQTYVRFGDKGFESEWKAIYGLNHAVLIAAWRDAGLWEKAWDPANPPEALERLPLPAGVELLCYRRRVPRPWYGWCELSGIDSDREVCDPQRSAAEAFRAPDLPYVGGLRDTDFAAYPVRDVSARDMLEFAEWAGCHLPTEYEFERAGRGDRPRGAWLGGFGHRAYAFADHRRVQAGGAPFRVDDDRFEEGDGPYGTRHHLGNVWQLTRTFFDLHPMLEPRPPPPEPNLTAYALVAKGGSYADGSYLVQLSARADKIGTTGWLTLDSPNRATTLGLRLVRHARPGEDLLRHAAHRVLYERERAFWIRDVPPRLAWPRMAGMDAVNVVADGAPYVHVRDRARGVGFVPRWDTVLTEWMVGTWKERGEPDAEVRPFVPLGILRSDLPLRAGRRLDAAALALLRDRRAAGGPGAEPDAYERAMDGLGIGTWREGILEPGEWWLGVWNGWIALAHRSLVVPPLAILPVQSLTVEPGAAGPATLVASGDLNALVLTFDVEEGESDPPGQAQSDLWALCETLPEGWPGRKPASHRWRVQVELPFTPGALYVWQWNGPQ